MPPSREMIRLKSLLVVLHYALVFLLFLPVLLWGASSLVITDKLGRTITVDVPVKRAVVVITYELVPALGIWDQVVGVSRWAEEECDIYRTIVHKSPHLKRPHVGIGTDINAEAVMALNPDLVITWSYNEKAIRFLEEKGVKVIAVYPESLQELYDLIRMHGALFGKDARAQEVIDEMEKLFRMIKERVDRIPPDRRLKVIHLGGKPTTVSGAVGVTNDLVTIAGGVNIGGEIKDRNADVSVEQIIRWNPDVILIWGNAGYGPEWLLENSQWRYVKAVQEKRVYKLPKWSTWSPRLAPIALWVAMKLYPEKFRDISFEEVTKNFYRKVFGISDYSF